MTNLIINICRCGIAFVSGQGREREKKEKEYPFLSFKDKHDDLGMLLFDVFYEQLTRLHVF